MPDDRDRVLRDIRRRKIAIAGLGVSNQALLRFLLARGARSVAAGDAKTADQFGPSADWLRTLPIDLRLGPGYLDVLEKADLVFLTPGMRKDLPEIAAARARGAEISSEIGLFLKLTQAQAVGITGSAGKTTTTTLVGDMLARSGQRVFVGGNIGTPPIERCLEFGPETTVVLELSSFQLQLVDRSPHVAAVLNVAPNHLDVHQDYGEYVQAKKGIYRHQRVEDWAVFGADNAETLKMARERAAMGPGVALFGKREPPAVGRGVRTVHDRGEDRLRGGAAVAPPGGDVRIAQRRETRSSFRAWIDGDRLVVSLPGRSRPAELCRVADVRLRGEHNLLNILAATLVTLLAGGRLEAASRVATTFETLEHRLEPVVEVAGVTFINDSIGTAPDRTEVALASFPAPIHLILGGYDKKIPFDSLAENVVRCGKVRKVVLLGQTAPKIRRALEEAMAAAPVSEGKPQAGPAGDGIGALVLAEAGTLDEAVREAFAGAAPGTTVLLSPACASFDMFRNYEDRGQAFKAAARTLAEKVRARGEFSWSGT